MFGILKLRTQNRVCIAAVDMLRNEITIRKLIEFQNLQNNVSRAEIQILTTDV